jgi:signal transduction histidine kinase
MSHALFYIVVISFLIPTQATGQGGEIEKLKKELENHPQPDTFRINRLNKLGELYGYNHIKDLDATSQEALDLSQKIGYARGEAAALITRSKVALYSGKREQAIDLIMRVDSLAKQLNDDVLQFKAMHRMSLCYSEKDNREAVRWALKSEAFAQQLNNKKLLFRAQLRAAEVYTNLSDYARAMEYSIKSQNTGAAANCFDCEVISWGRIAHVYTITGNYDMSNMYYQKQLAAYKENKSSNTLMAALYSNIGENSFRLKRDYPEALHYFHKALALDTGTARREVTNISIAYTYLELDSLAHAFNYAYEGLGLARKSDDLVLQAWVESVLANAYLKKSMPDSALHFASSGLKHAKFVSNVEHMHRNALALANAYSMKNDFKKAFQFQKLSMNYRDSILSNETKNRISVMEHSSELERTQSQIELLNQQKKTQQNFLITISVIFLMMILTAFGLFRLSRQKTKYIHQRQLLISAVQTQEDERKRIAQDLHDEMGAVLSIARMHLVQIQEQEGGGINTKATLQQAQTLTESAIATMRRISHELMPPQLEEFGLIKTLRAIANQVNESKKITLEIIVADDLPRWAAAMELGLYRICMELINNTLKHAEAQNITIRLTQKDNQCVCSYSDDGKGLRENYSEGHGFRNIEARLNSLGGSRMMGNQPKGGFYASFILPLNEKVNSL